MTCRIDDGWAYRGLGCIRLENEHMAVDVLPELGGNIFRLIDKLRDHDLLWKSPRVQPHRAELHANFDDHWAGGWDEAFPGGAPSPNRHGDQLPYMGELWTQAARYEIGASGPDAVELVLTIDTPITPARWTRRLRLERGSPALTVSYRLEHTGFQPFDFNWGIFFVARLRWFASAKSAGTASWDGSAQPSPPQWWSWEWPLPSS